MTTDKTPGAMVLVPREAVDAACKIVRANMRSSWSASALAALTEALSAEQPPAVGGEPIDPTPGFTQWFNDAGKEGLASELGVEELMEGAYAAGRRAHVAPLLAEIERLKLHFNAMQLQRDHHRDGAESLKARIAELEARNVELVSALTEIRKTSIVTQHARLIALGLREVAVAALDQSAPASTKLKG